MHKQSVRGSNSLVTAGAICMLLQITVLGAHCLRLLMIAMRREQAKIEHLTGEPLTAFSCECGAVGC